MKRIRLVETVKFITSRAFQKISSILCVLVFGSFSFYFLFDIYISNRESKISHYLIAVSFLLIALYVLVNSIKALKIDNDLNTRRDLAIAAFLIVVSVCLKYLNINQISGINFNLSLNHSIFNTITTLLFNSMLVVYLVVPKNFSIKLSERKIITLIIVVSTLIYFFLTASLQYKFSTSAFDLGIFDQVVWKYSQFITPYDTIVGIHDMADHFEPILFVVGLFYRLFSSVYLLLFFEAFIVSIGFYPIYQLAKKYLKNQNSAILIGLGYLFSLGITQAIHYPVHPGTWLPTFYAFALYFIDNKKYYFYFLFLFLAFLTKENAFIHILFIGVFVAIAYRQKLIGAITAFLAIIFYLFIFKISMPYFNGGLSYVHGIFDNISNDPKVFINFVVLHPINTLKIAFNYPVKSQTLYLTFGTAGLLSIFSSGSLLLVLPFMVERLLSNHSAMMTMNFHYSAPVTAIVFITAIFAINKFKTVQTKNALALFVFLCSFTFMASNYFYASPLNNYLSISNFKITDREKLANDVLKSIPGNASVTAQDVFVPHLSHRDSIRLYDGNFYQSDYIILSKTPEYGSWPVSFNVINNQVANLKQNEEYVTLKENSKVILFKKR